MSSARETKTFIINVENNIELIKKRSGNPHFLKIKFKPKTMIKYRGNNGQPPSNKLMAIKDKLMEY
jgi:hypothetical protein